MLMLGKINGLQRLAATGDATAREMLASIGLWTSDELREEQRAHQDRNGERLPHPESIASGALEDSILFGEGASLGPDTGEMLDADFLPDECDEFDY